MVGRMRLTTLVSSTSLQALRTSGWGPRSRKAIGLLVAPVVLVAAPDQLHADGPDLVEIREPAQHEVFECDPVELILDVDLRAAQQKPLANFEVLLNSGRQSIDDLEPTDTGFRALLSAEDGVRVGTGRADGKNTVVARVFGPGLETEKDRRRFTVRADDAQIPLADAGEDRVAILGETITLDGTGSAHPSCASILNYRWEIVEAPDGSRAELADADTAAPTLQPDIPGLYVIELTADTGLQASTDQIEISAEERHALAIGSVDSPAYDLLVDVLQPVTYDGTQDLADFDALIVDGDAHEPAALLDHPIVSDAYDRGKHIIAVDLQTAHKRDWLVPLTNVGMQEPSDVLVLRRSFDEGGWPLIQTIETAPIEGNAEAPADPALVALTDAATARQSQIEWGAGAALDAMRRQPGPLGEPSPSIVIQPDMYHLWWQHTTSADLHIGGSGKGRRGSQTATHQTNIEFYLMLENPPAQDPPLKFLGMLVNGRMDPRTSGDFIAWRTDERAWFQDRMLLEIQPTDDIWTWKASTPQTPNNVSTYDNSIDVTIGYTSKKGAQALLDWKHGMTETITDWEVVANNRQTATQVWDFRSNNPSTASAQPGDRYGNTEWFSRSSDYPRKPNELSQDEMQYFASMILFADGDAHSEVTAIRLVTQQHLVDLWCDTDFGALCTDRGGGQDRQSAATTVKADATLAVNLAAIDPRLVEKITFDKNPVVNRERAFATIELDEKAVLDLQLTVASSDVSVVTPQSSNVTVKGKQKTATVCIDTTTLPDNLSERDVFISVTTPQQRENEVPLRVVSGQPTDLRTCSDPS